MGLEIIAAGTGLFAGATGIPQYFAQKEAATDAQQAQEEANRVRQAQSQVENARRRRQAIAQARMAQAQNVAAQGEQVQSSSALSGVQSSLSAQLGSNIGAQRQRIRAGERVNTLNQQAANFLREGQEEAGLWDVAGNIGQMIGSFGLSNAGGPSGGATSSAGQLPYSESFLGPRGI